MHPFNYLSKFKMYRLLIKSEVKMAGFSQLKVFFPGIKTNFVIFLVGWGGGQSSNELSKF